MTDHQKSAERWSYSNLKEVTPERFQMVLKDLEWVAERVELLLKSESHAVCNIDGFNHKAL